MLLKELVSACDVEAVLVTVTRLYELDVDEVASYRQALDELRTLAVAATVWPDPAPAGVLTHEHPGDLHPWIKHYGDLEFTAWEDALHFEIDPATLRALTPLDLLAHVLYGLTWSGFSSRDVQIGKAKFERALEEALTGEELTRFDPIETRATKVKLEALILEKYAIPADQIGVALRDGRLSDHRDPIVEEWISTDAILDVFDDIERAMPEAKNAVD